MFVSNEHDYYVFNIGIDKGIRYCILFSAPKSLLNVFKIIRSHVYSILFSLKNLDYLFK